MASDEFLVDVEGYAGPLDVLLSLARDQKVDLRCISVLALAEQYLAFVSDAAHTRLPLAAEYLVMAAWLAYLKSRLLLPQPADGEPSGEDLAAALARQLEELETMRAAGAWLVEQPRLGRDVFARGQPETVGPRRVGVIALGLFDLLKAYGEQARRRHAAVLRIEPPRLTSVEAALRLLRRVLRRLAGWQSLWTLLPPGTAEGLRAGRLQARSAVAATLVAGLELAREGSARLRQVQPFATIEITGTGQEEQAHDLS
jgi:segregation and condensation protein A